ncbi:MAG: YheT family hydrolase [Candidatus Promineifilaceae bacterium]
MIAYIVSKMLQNRHVQTILSFVILPPEKIQFETKRVAASDGGFLELAFPTLGGRWADLPDGPIVLVLHGIGGTAQGVPLQHAYWHLLEGGFRPIGLNSRGSSPAVHQDTPFAHYGASAEVGLAVEWISTQYDSKISLLGISLGGCLMLKYLGEQTPHPSICAAAAISSPFNYWKTSLQLQTPAGRLYHHAILRRMKQIMRQKRAELQPHIDVDAALAASSMLEFDRQVATQLYGHRDLSVYLEQTSVDQFLHAIKTPTLIIRSLDDPMHDATDIDHAVVSNNPHLEGCFLPTGGHTGFFALINGRIQPQAQRHAVQFLFTQTIGANGD